MTLPPKYENVFIPVKYFLNSYRALSDGRSGVRHLEEQLKSNKFLLSDWKVIWIGACTLLRASVSLFQVDAKSCINQKIREEIRAEWKSIKDNKDDHPIFWNFLRNERNNIIHQYEWAAYEVWLDQEGTVRTDRMSILTDNPEYVTSVLIMRGGPYKDRNSLDLLNESAAWVEARIYGAIRRAGFDPDEERNLVNFQTRPSVDKTALGR